MLEGAARRRPARTHAPAPARQLLHGIADKQIDTSEMDSGLLDVDLKVLKGIFVNRYYQLISVAVQKAVFRNLQRATKRVYTLRGAPHRNLRSGYTAARAHNVLGTAYRLQDSPNPSSITNAG